MKNTPWGMSKARLWFVHGLILFIFASSAFDIAAKKVSWPFSSYPMFSELRREPTLTFIELFGIPEAEPTQEIPLVDFEYLQPFDRARLAGAFKRLKSRAHREELLRGALDDLLARYETHRREGRHHGPPLRGMRIYELYWRLDPWARNVDEPPRRELWAERVRPEGGKP